MTRFHRIELWAVLVLSGLLLVLSIAGSFLGVPGAAGLFNSGPLVVFWFLLAGLLIAGLYSFKQLRQRPGSLMMHLAALLILAGAMWGSTRGHEAANDLLGEKKVPSGYVQISRGYTNNLITSEAGAVLGHLPFSLYLSNFQIEYYPAREQNWLLVLEWPRSLSPAGTMKDEEEGPVQQIKIPWKVGEDVTVPGIDLRFKVLQYLPAARPVFDEKSEPTLKIVTTAKAPTVLPAKVGQKAALDEPKVEVEIVEVFANLVVPGMTEDLGPTLKVQLTWPDGKKEVRHVMSLFPNHGQKDDGLRLSYDCPEPIGAAADPKSTKPAMEVLLTHADKQQRQWFVPGANSDESSWITLGPLLEQQASDLRPQTSGTATTATTVVIPGAGSANPSPGPKGPPSPKGEGLTATTASPSMAHPPMIADIALVKPQGQVESYISSVAVTDHVLEEGAEVSEKDFVATKDIKVNDPMHYGGYHFYQYNFGHDPGTAAPYTVLSVTSDSGLLAVWAGFILLMAGTVWHCWARPTWAYVRGRGSNGD